ncbi:MAG: hypothetical protein ABSC06_33820 [Rhodopila sp.]
MVPTADRLYHVPTIAALGPVATAALHDPGFRALRDTAGVVPLRTLWIGALAGGATRLLCAGALPVWVARRMAGSPFPVSG